MPSETVLLDDPQQWSLFSQRNKNDDACWISHVVIEGMHCAACALTVEAALSKVPGVDRVVVNAASHRAQIQWRSALVTPSQWMAALAHSGYRALPAHDAFTLQRRKLEMRRALWRWLVAGMCMMQIMMYAFPSYDAKPGDLTAEMEQLLRWASWVLSLPILFFSSGIFFSNAWRDVKQLRISMDLPVAMGIAITFVVSTVGTFEPAGAFGKEVYFDSLSMFVFFLLSGRLLELRMRDRTAGALDALMNRLPESVERQTAEGGFERIVARRVEVGDVLRVQPGESFVADGLILQGTTLVDEALLTGESHPLERAAGSQVIAGSYNLQSTVFMKVKKTGQSTRYAEMVALMESAATSKPAMAQRVDRIAPYFLLAVLVAALVAGAWHWASGPSHALMVAVSILIVTCPCALSLATPAAMLASAGTLARSGVLVRHLQAIETLAGIDTLVFDKTGTLTEGRMALQQLETRSGVERSAVLALAAALAQHSLHPVSQALLACAKAELGLHDMRDNAVVCHAVQEIPGQGVEGSVTLPSGDQHAVRWGSAPWCGVEPSLSAQGLQVYLSDAQGWLATFTLREALRPQAQAVVAGLQAAQVQVHLLSGDRTGAVQALAAQVGITQARGDCSPAMKLDALQALQHSGHTVAMVGDGLNDGPVLAGAHVSFALGQAVPLAQAKSDFVLLGGQLQGVLDAVRLSRRTLRIVRQNLWWSLLYNAASVPLAVVGLMPAWLAGLGMAASSLLVVMNALRLSKPLSAPAEMMKEH
jgi:P-type Cu2+ transporter